MVYSTELAGCSVSGWPTCEGQHICDMPHHSVEVEGRTLHPVLMHWDDTGRFEPTEYMAFDPTPRKMGQNGSFIIPVPV